jgi:hypothetical protein
MAKIINKFSKYLESIEYPTQKTSWNIAGIIKGQNAFYKFDVREMFNLPDGTFAQEGSTDTQANKMVLEMEDKWVILDLEELHQYIKKNKLTKVYVNDLISKLEWTIFLAKNSIKGLSMLQKLGFKSGFNKQATASGAEAEWIDGNFVRFRYGLT